MKVLGITGGSGCGKTTLLQAAEELGFRCIDCDALYHELLRSNSAMLAELKAQFPTAFSSEELDRKALGNIVFQDEAQLQVLNSITHRYVKQEVLHQIYRNPADRSFPPNTQASDLQGLHPEWTHIW